jgi:hypothetical protein
MKKHGETRKNTVFDGKLMAEKQEKGRAQGPPQKFFTG